MTASEVSGGVVYSADMLPSVATTLANAVVARDAAYTDAKGRNTDVVLNAGAAGGDLANVTLAPGLYKWTAGGGNVSISLLGNLTLSGAADDVWIFQIPGTLTVAAAKHVTLIGAQAKNIFWQVEGAVTLGAGAHLEGIILGGPLSAITLGAGALMNGALLSQNAISMGALAHLTKNP